MKKLNANELRSVEGGKWKCVTCGAKYWTFIKAVTHINCEAHYDGGWKVSNNVKWCWW